MNAKRTIPEYKRKLVSELVEKMKSNKTILVASIKSLPTSQFQKIKKNLRGKAEIRVVKKSIIIRAIEQTEKGALQNLKAYIDANIVLFFSDIDTFKLSSLLTENQSPAKAKAGDIALKDIEIEPGPTDLPPGPAISELSNVGLKVAVEAGKLAIKKGATIAKQGSPISENVANVLSKLNILPMKVGFIPLASYDSESDKVYVDIKIDKKATLEALKNSISKALGFAINIQYTIKETISYFISRAAVEEKALENLVHKNNKEEA